MTAVMTLLTALLLPIGSVPAFAAAPDAPTAVTAVMGESGAFVTWQAAGGAPVTGYTVVVIDKDAGTETLHPATGHVLGRTVTGLSNGHDYRFTVFASNGPEDGPRATPTAAAAPVDALRPGKVVRTISGVGASGSGPANIVFSPDSAKVFAPTGNGRMVAIDLANPGGPHATRYRRLGRR